MITDLRIKGRGFDWEFRRAYRSFNYRPVLGVKDFGENWTFTYADEFLRKDGTGSDDSANYILFRSSQNEGAFVNVSSGKWEAPLARFTQLRKNPNTLNFELRERDGMVRIYHNFSDTATPNKNGRLKELVDRNGNRMTFHYTSMDPDSNVSGDDKFVLTHVVDTMGREIRYTYYARTAQAPGGRQVAIATTNTASFGRLAYVEDFKGNMDFTGTTQPDFTGQDTNRRVVFDYDSEGNLVKARRPIVLGTPQGNNFSNGKTTRYKYILTSDLSTLVSNWASLTTAQQDVVKKLLLHKMTRVWYPNEVRESLDTNPPDADAAEVVTYNTTATFESGTSTFLVQGSFLGFATSYTVGGENPLGVPSGGTITYTYTDLNPTKSMGGGVFSNPTTLYTIQNLKVEVADRNGNDAEYIYGGGKQLLEYREKTLDNFRTTEPTDYLLKTAHNGDRLKTKATLPESTGPTNGTKEFSYNSGSTDRFQQPNFIRRIHTPDPRGGDQTTIEHVLVYEPIYNRPCLRVLARGANKNGNGFTPPIADPVDRTMTDPYDGSKVLNLRYAIVEFFDFQEATEKASQAPAGRLDKDGSGGQVNQSPLISVDANVLTTEVWLVQILGLTEDSAGLTELRARLTNNLTKLGLGDLNGDADITPTVAGNIVRTVFGSPVLLSGTNQHSLEQAIDPIDLIDASKPYDQGGTFESTTADNQKRLQTIVWMYQYNKFGQVIQTISPEANVTTHEFFAENDPDGDGNLTPTPADGRTLGTQDSAADRTNGGGGYVHFTVVDRTRTDSYVKFFDQAGTNKATATFHNNNTAPAATDIKTCACIYDDVGNLIQRHDPRGIRTDYFVNELDEVVQVTRAADVSEASSANPTDPLVGASIGPLTAFAYKSRTYFDYNGNVVLSQTEDRGNTSSVDGSGLGTLPSHVINTTPGLSSADGTGSEAWVDTLSLFDRLNNRIEVRVEVDATRSLNTRYRYDGNQHLVLVIYPEGNADNWIYDERELLFQMTRGASTRPSAGKYASGDPTNFDRPGGAGTQSSTFTYNYDKNQNRLETVDALSHGGTGSSIAGSGDATKQTYDGYDRLKTVTDPLGNKATYLYDPDSNVVRVIRDGDPIDDIAGASENKTLSVTETIHDEFSRTYVVHQVLYQTPDAVPSRTPTLTDTSSMDTLAAYLADASSDTASVPGATGITVIGRVTSITEYDRESRMTFSIQDDLDVTRADYDGANRVVKSTDSVLSHGFSGGVFNPANLSGNMVEAAYDDNSNTIEIKETDVTPVANVANESFRTTRLYDSLGRLQTNMDSLGQTTDLRYDSRSNQVAMADAVGPVTLRTINRRGLGSTALVTANDFGNVTRNYYDGPSRLLETEAQLTSSGQGNGTYIGATLEGVKDDLIILDSNQSGDGRISVYTAYDDNSQTLALRDDNGNTTAYIYDNQNRMLKERKGLGLTGTSFTISGGDSGAFNVGLRGGVTPVDTEASGTDFTLTYDRDWNVTTTVDEAGNTRDCTFDALNRRKTCSITAVAGFIGTRGTNAQTWKYDGLSRKTECTDVNEPTPTSDDVLCTYAYDSLSRKVEETQKIGSLSAKALSCSYDISASGAESHPSMCTYPDGRKVHSRYDNLDRLVRRFDDDGTTQYTDIGKYEYIGVGRVAVLTYQNETRLSHIGQVSSQNADVGFDGLRRIVNHRWESFTTQALGNGTLVVGFEHRDGASTPASLYDRANNKRVEYKTHDSSNSEQYKYDSSYRLTSTGSGSQGQDTRGFERGMFTSTARTSMAGNVAFFQDWDLEGLGNWAREDDNARVETRTHSDFNEIVDRVVSAQTATLTHDKNGNTTDTGYSSLSSQNFPGGGLRLEWDALNRLRKVFKNNNTPGSTGDDVLVGEYTYDCENRRLRKVVTNSGSLNGTTDFYYEGWRNLEERDGSDAVMNQYVFGNYLDEAWTLDNRRNGVTIANLNSSISGTNVDRHFYHQNTLYHVYGLTDEDGQLREAYEYDAYGRQSVITDGNDGDVIVNFNANDVRTLGGASTINGNPWTYTGQRFESESGLMYYKNRYYSQNLGRFVSRDSLPQYSPIGLYEYCKSSPIMWLDSVGKDPCLTMALGGLGLGCICKSAVSIIKWLFTDSTPFIDVVQDCICGGLSTALAAFILCHYPTLQGGCLAGAAATIANTFCNMIFDGIRKGSGEIKKDALVGVLSAPVNVLLGCLAGGLGEAATPKEKLTQLLAGAAANVATKVIESLK